MPLLESRTPFNSLRKKAKSQEQGILPLLRENVASAVLVLRRPQTLGRLVRAVASGVRRSQVRERGEREEKAWGAEGGQVQGTLEARHADQFGRNVKWSVQREER